MQFFARRCRTRCLGVVTFEALESRTLLSANVVSYHNNSQSTGLNDQEVVLTPTNIDASTFGKRFATAVDGQVYSQPLYVEGVTITAGGGQGVHNVVFVATAHDSLYAIDSVSGNVLWKTAFANGIDILPVPTADVGSQDITPEIGIISTPAIDTQHQVMYVATKTKEIRPADANGVTVHYVHTLRRVQLSDGAYTSVIIADTGYKNGQYFYRQDADPYTINNRTLGTADGAVQVGAEWRVYFNALRQMIRPGIMLHDNQIVLASASHGDQGPYHGWVLQYDVSGTTPVLNGLLNTTPNGAWGGIWQGGGIVSRDEQGYMYFETGNGSFTPYRSGANVLGLDSQGFPTDGNFGDSFVKIGVDPIKNSPTNQNRNGWGLQVVDYFTPFNEQPLDASDRDLGSGGPLVLPDVVGSLAHPHLLVGAGKEGKIYLIDRDKMGGVDPGYNQNGVDQTAFGGTDHVVQTIGGAVSGVLNTMAFFNAGTAQTPDYRIYITPGYGGEAVKSYNITAGVIDASGSGGFTDPKTSNGGGGYLNGSPSVSSNGLSNGIVWMVERNTNQLRAYDASTLKGSSAPGRNPNTLYTSADKAADNLGAAVKFSVPTVAGGQVFVGTSNSIVAYGPPVPPTAPPAPPSQLVAKSTFPSQIVLTWFDNSDNEDRFLVERSPNGVDSWLEVGLVGVNSSQYIDNSVSANTTYYYRVRAHNSYLGDSYSAYSNNSKATTIPAPPIGTGDGLKGVYYNNMDFTGGRLTRIDPRIDYDWGTGSPAPAIGADTFSAIWTGVIQAQYSESYTFYTNSDDGVRLFINGIAVIDHYNDHAPTEDSSAPISMVAGQTYQIRMEWYENAGGAVAQLLWSSEHTPKVFVPQKQLYSGVTSVAPRNLAGIAASSTQVDLSWTDLSQNETGFIVERKQGANGLWQQVGIAPANATQFLDTELQANTEYYWRVKAANFDTSSAYSGEFTLVTPIPPNTPSDAHPTAVTTTSISFAWNDNSNNETRFAIFRKVGTLGGFVFVAELPQDTTNYTDGNLVPGTFYDYHIQAGNVAGFSDFAGFTVTTVPLPPTHLALVRGDQQVLVAWAGATGANSYHVYRSQQNNSLNPELISTVTVPNFVDNQVVNGVTYYYRISAISTGGESAPSAQASSTPVSGAKISDFNADGAVDAFDVEQLFENWGGSGLGDLNADGTIDAADASILFADWTGDPLPLAGTAARKKVFSGDGI